MGMGALVSQCLSAPSEVTTNRSRSAYWCRMLSDVCCRASLPHLRRHANEKRLRTLVLHEGRIHFSRAGVAVRVNSGVEQQIVLPYLAPTFASKLSRNTNLLGR